MRANETPKTQALTPSHSDRLQVRREFLERMRAARERSYELLRQRLRTAAA